MPAIAWDQIGERTYEAGLDRGVLYPVGESGVAWNGLTAIDEIDGNTVEPVYFDGIKFNDLMTLGNFSGVLKAFTYPDEFLQCEGVLEDQTGVFITGQPVKRFHLCYRTKIGTDSGDVNDAYKLHLLYNLTAIPSQRVRQTLGMVAEPLLFEWNLTSIPEDIGGYRPTSHIIIDSRTIDPWLLKDLEDILYGDAERNPTLPNLKALTTFIRKWDRFIILDNGDGTWTAISKDDSDITMVSSTEFMIEAENVVYLDDDTYTIGSSDKNEEDI